MSARDIARGNRVAVRLAMMRERYAAIFLVAVSLAYCMLIGRNFPFDAGDEGYVLYIAQQLLRGRQLYVDIELFNYLPGVFYLFVPFVWAARENVPAIHAALGIPIILCAWLVYRIVADQVGSLPGVVAALLFVAAPGDWHRFYIAALNLGILLCAVRYLRTGSSQWQVGLGIVTGVALCVRIDAAVAGFVLLVLCIVATRWLSATVSPARAIRDAACGLAISLVPLWLLIAAEGILGDYFRQVAGFPQGILARTTAEYQLTAPGLRAIWWGSTFAAIYYASLLVPISTAAALLDLRAPVRDRLIWTAIAAWLVCNLPQFLVERPDETHLSHRTYALVVPAVIFVCEALRRARSANAVGLRWRIVLAWSVVIIGGLAFALLIHASPGSAGTAIRGTQEICLANGVCYPDNSPAGTPHALMDEVLKRLTSTEPVAVTPYGPGIAFLLRHRLPGRQLFLLPHSVRLGQGEDEFIRSLQTTNTRYTLLNRGFRYARTGSGTLAGYAPRVDRFLKTCFSPVQEQRGWALLERTSPTCAL